MADYPHNFGPVEVELADGTLRTIYVPGVTRADQIAYAESLYNTPGIYLLPTERSFRYFLYYGTLRGNSHLFGEVKMTGLVHLGTLGHILNDYSAFVNYIEYIYPLDKSIAGSLYELTHLVDPEGTILKIIYYLNSSLISQLNDIDKNELSEFVHEFPYNFDNRVDHIRRFYERLVSMYTVLMFIYDLPELNPHYFPLQFKRTRNSIEREEYINDLKDTIYLIFNEVKEPGYD
jgi:hypothetical protein